MPTQRPYYETLISSRANGAALTAAARASAIPAGSVITLEPGYFDRIGKAIRVRASGRISIVITTPGTARYDLSFTDSAAVAVVVFDSLAMPLNIVAKTDVHWELDTTLVAGIADMTVQQLFPRSCKWTSHAVIGSLAPTAGGAGSHLIPFNAAPALGTAFNATLSQSVNLFFTQTEATGSMTLHEYEVTALN